LAETKAAAPATERYTYKCVVTICAATMHGVAVLVTAVGWV
jgi:hypothetical protein